MKVKKIIAPLVIGLLLIFIFCGLYHRLFSD